MDFVQEDDGAPVPEFQFFFGDGDRFPELFQARENSGHRHGVSLAGFGGDTRQRGFAGAGIRMEDGQAALDMLKLNTFDCVILDLSLPDMTGFEVLNQINQDKDIAKCPIIIYTGRDLTPEENAERLKYADSVIVKGAKSPERLLDETALFLHQVVADMPTDKRRTIKKLYNQEDLLQDKRI